VGKRAAADLEAVAAAGCATWLGSVNSDACDGGRDLSAGDASCYSEAHGLEMETTMMESGLL
jgi:hypothetical protein